MKKFITALMTILISATIISVPSYAKETFAERCQRRQREAQEQFVADLEREGNLTQEAIDAFGVKGKQPQKKSSKTTTSGNTASTSTYTGEARGWVYSTDEMHVVGLPENEQGYTASGDYGVIPK